jgi:hypothetical protein
MVGCVKRRLAYRPRRLNNRVARPITAPGANEGPNRLMPTLFRFLTIVAITVAVAYAAMFALATLVKPRQGEMSVEVPLENRIGKASP